SFFATPSTRSMAVCLFLYGLNTATDDFPLSLHDALPISMLNRSAGRVCLDLSARKEEPEMFRRIVEAAPNAIVLVNREGKITLINAQTEKLYGNAGDALIGQAVVILKPERFRSKHPGHRT